MRVVTSRAVVVVGEIRILYTARVVILFCVSSSFSRFWINVAAAEFFPTLPTPALAATRALVKISVIVQAACEDEVAGFAFECPLLAPGALFCLSHLLEFKLFPKRR